MRYAAKDHVRDIGKLGTITHKGSDGSTSTERLKKYGDVPKVSAQTICYGEKTPYEACLAILIDDGIPSRSQRKAFFH